MALTSFPEPKDLEVSFAERTADSKNIILGTHDVSNPHPGFGKDPNIGNEFGHTHYPKYVTDADGKSVVVNNPDEEAEVAGEASIDPDSGPTVSEFVAAGYKASNYPPKGYNSKSSKEEIEAAIAAEPKAATGGWGK